MGLRHERPRLCHVDNTRKTSGTAKYCTTSQTTQVKCCHCPQMGAMCPQVVALSASVLGFQDGFERYAAPVVTLYHADSCESKGCSPFPMTPSMLTGDNAHHPHSPEPHQSPPPRQPSAHNNPGVGPTAGGPVARGVAKFGSTVGLRSKKH